MENIDISGFEKNDGKIVSGIRYLIASCLLFIGIICPHRARIMLINLVGVLFQIIYMTAGLLLKIIIVNLSKGLKDVKK